MLKFQHGIIVVVIRQGYWRNVSHLFTAGRIKLPLALLLFYETRIRSTHSEHHYDVDL